MAPSERGCQGEIQRVGSQGSVCELGGPSVRLLQRPLGVDRHGDGQLPLAPPPPAPHDLARHPRAPPRQDGQALPRQRRLRPPPRRPPHRPPLPHHPRGLRPRPQGRDHLREAHHAARARRLGVPQPDPLGRTGPVDGVQRPRLPPVEGRGPFRRVIQLRRVHPPRHLPAHRARGAGGRRPPGGVQGRQPPGGGAVPDHGGVQHGDADGGDHGALRGDAGGVPGDPARVRRPGQGVGVVLRE
mmetsp:Transcript_4131/g.9792  ORF Transcript_4131/g.9792 Transcript_4131/m.9792 type:complete len:242 (+) Transcript_4131:729-1454(+)